MRQTARVLLVVAASAVCASCLGEDHDRCGEGFDYEDNSCMVAESAEEPDGQGNDAGTEIDPEQWIGTNCSCSPLDESPCDVAGIPLIHQGEITGCDSVPAVWTGALPACQRSYTGELNSPTYYANGYCTLVAVDCTGDQIVCTAALIGDYGAMKACPADTVLLEWTTEVDTSGLQGTVFFKACAATCETDEDCRNGEDDPVFNEKTQYQCLDRDGVRFCQDPRNLSSDYTAEAF